MGSLSSDTASGGSFCNSGESPATNIHVSSSGPFSFHNGCISGGLESVDIILSLAPCVHDFVGLEQPSVILRSIYAINSLSAESSLVSNVVTEAKVPCIPSKSQPTTKSQRLSLLVSIKTTISFLFDFYD